MIKKIWFICALIAAQLRACEVNSIAHQILEKKMGITASPKK